MKLITVTDGWLKRPSRYGKSKTTKICRHCKEEFKVGDKVWLQQSVGRNSYLGIKYTCETCEDKRRY